MVSSLDKDTIAKLLKQEERKKKGKPEVEGVFQGWTGEDNLVLLAQAVERKEHTVELDVGNPNFSEGVKRYNKEGKPITKRKFIIRYTQHFGGAVYVHTMDGSTACGYFSLKTLRDVLTTKEL